MSEFLAEAQVVVRANTKLFLADFQKAVKKAEATQVTVTVRASMTGFRADLTEKLKLSTRGLSVKVPVRPDMRGFRKALQAELATAGKGLRVPVTVGGAAAGAATGRAVAGGGVVDRRAAAAQLAVNAAVDAGVAARRRITAEISAEEKFAARLERQELHLKAAMEAVNKAALSGVPALLERAQAEQRAARAALADSAAQQERATLGVPVGVATADFKAQLAAQTALSASRQKAQEIEAAHAAALIENQRRIQSAGKLESAAIAENERRDRAVAAKAEAATNKRLKGIQAEIKALQARAAVARAAFAESPRGVSAAQATGGIKESQADIARARRISTSAALVEVDAQRRLTTANNVLRINTDALVVAEEAYQAALASGSALTIKAAADNLKLAEAEQIAAAAAAKQASAEAIRTNVLVSARRAIVAQIANLTGLRGAALTAASGFIAASAAVIGLNKAVGLASKLQSELAVFQVTAGATAEQMEKVREKAVELGRDITLPGVSGQDAAVALTELSKAGLSVQNSLEGARGVLQLATAANIDFTQATNLTASALNAFGLAGEDASHVADVLANSANQSQGSITDAGVALQQSAAVARQAGLSLEQTVAALTLFARAGLRGSDAGTSLRTALIRLINPSTKAQETIKRLGLNLRTATGAIDLDVFQQFTDATRNLTAAQRDQALAIIFGQDAIRGAAILAREGAAGLEAQEKAIGRSGTAARVAGARTSGYAGAVENLKNQIEALGEELGTALLPSLTGIVTTLADSVEAIGETIDVIGQLRQAVLKPIDIVIRRIFKNETEGGQPIQIDPRTGELVEPTTRKQGAVERITRRVIFATAIDVPNLATDSVQQFKKTSQELSESLEDALGVDFVAPPTFLQAMKEIREQIDAVNKSKLSPEITDEAIRKLRQLAEDMRGSAIPKEQQLATQLDAFIKKLQDASARPGVVSVEARFLDDAFKQEVDVARSKLNDLVDELNKDPSKEAFQSTLRSLKELQANLLSSGRTSSRQFGRDMQDLIDRVQAAAKQPIPINIQVPDLLERLPNAEDLRKQLGPDFKTGGFLASEAFWNEFELGISPHATEAGLKSSNIFTKVFANAFANLAPKIPPLEEAFGPAAKQFREDLNKAVDAATTQGQNQVLGTQRAQVQARLQGDAAGELSALQQRATIFRRQSAKILKAFFGEEIPAHPEQKLTGQALESFSKAQSDLADTMDQISAQRAERATEVKNKSDDADQKLLDALAPATRRLDTRALIAQGTKSLQDDIDVAKAQQADNLHRIAVIEKSFNDRKKAAELISDLRDENIRLGQQISDNTESIFQNALQLSPKLQQRFDTAQAQGNIQAQIKILRQSIKSLDSFIKTEHLYGDKLVQARASRQALQSQIDDLNKTRIDSRLSLAAAQDNVPLQIKLNERRIKDIDRLIRTEHIIGDKLTQLKAERAGRLSTIQDLRDQQLADRTALGQSIFDLTGNKSPLLNALTAEIRNKQREIAAAKKAGKSTVKLQTELNVLKKQRKDVLDDAQEGAKEATTAFDLLKQFSDTFNQNAGNLINANQPFAGPSGFTADIAQFLTRKSGAGLTTSGLTEPTATQLQHARVDLNDQPLILAIQEWTRVVQEQSGGNKSTAGIKTEPKESSFAKKRWFIESMHARDAQQG